METKQTPVIGPTAIHNVSIDATRALEILSQDPEQAYKLLARAINNLDFHLGITQTTQLVSVPDYLFADPDHPIFEPRPRN